MIPDTRKVLDPPSADQNHGVLLEIVSDAGDVGGDLDPLVSRTLATLRSAEFGFFGVVV